MQFDIVFISYNEPNADANYSALRVRFPYAKRLHGVQGIHNAHKQAAKMSFTEKFWVVDGDSQIEETFNFKAPKDLRDDAVYVYRARNAVNDLVYGYGGIKLLPKQGTMNVDTDATDMTTSISENFFLVDEIASVTCFNSDAFSAWRSAFRECVKLSSQVIDRQNYQETADRLNAWLTYYPNKPFAQEVAEGAVAGKEYGRANADNAEALKLINDFNWLQNKFMKTNS